MIGATEGVNKAGLSTAAMSTQYVIVKYTADPENFDVATAATDNFAGITQNTVDASGKTLSIAVSGISPITFGGTVTPGQDLTSDATGRGVAAAPGAGVNNDIIGRATKGGLINEVGICDMGYKGTKQG